VVNLTRIYTRTGDTGSTRLGDGVSTRKTDARVEAFGAVDETNAAIGVALTALADESLTRLLREVQNDLFDVGADLCRPPSPQDAAAPPLRVTANRVTRVERAIDEVNEQLSPLRSFVLPGGAPVAAYLHLARSICRRAERRAWTLVETAGEESVNPQVLAYLNRLSDLLFVLSRVDNLRQGMGDVLWQPGGESD
jgi:cob(I)alamin adenosyltransferase